MKFMEKLKVAKDAAKMGVDGTLGKIDEIQKKEAIFKEKELELLGKFEDKLDEVLENQELILLKLEEVKQEKR